MLRESELSGVARESFVWARNRKLEKMVKERLDPEVMATGFTVDHIVEEDTGYLIGGTYGTGLFSERITFDQFMTHTSIERQCGLA